MLRGAGKSAEAIVASEGRTNKKATRAKGRRTKEQSSMRTRQRDFESRPKRRGATTTVTTPDRLTKVQAEKPLQAAGVDDEKVSDAELTTESNARDLDSIRSCLVMKKEAAFNRRMRKTARPVVWEGAGAQSPALHPIVAPWEAPLLTVCPCTSL